MADNLRLLAFLAIVSAIALQFPVNRARSAEPSPQHAAAPAPSRETPSTLDTITIQARKDREIKRQITKFVSGGVVTQLNDSLQRWNQPICPLVAGLPSKSAEFIRARMSQVARDSHAPFGSEDCKPNLVVVATDDPDLLVENWYKRFRGSFNSCNGLGPVKKFLHSRQPVRVFYNAKFTSASSELLARTDILAQKGEQAAQGAANMYKPVYSHSIAKVRLRHLSGNDVREWRNQLVTEARPKKRARGKRGANRLFRQFAAALSYAKDSGAISSDEAWKKVGQFPVKDGNRPSYLSIVQRRALLAACEREKTPQELAEDRAAGRKELLYCTKDLADLLLGDCYTGARPGELAKARVCDFSVREAKLTLTSAKNKKGEARPRNFYLYEPEAFEFFKRMAQGKSPDQYLITMANGDPWVNEKGSPAMCGGVAECVLPYGRRIEC
jgi:integrase